MCMAFNDIFIKFIYVLNIFIKFIYVLNIYIKFIYVLNIFINYDLLIYSPGYAPLFTKEQWQWDDHKIINSHLNNMQTEIVKLAEFIINTD